MAKKSPKRSPKQLAKKKAWTLLSQAIRLEAADVDHYCQCITCGHRLFWNRGMQAGHFIDGRMNAILFDERGIHPQCMGCNVMMNGRKDAYFVWMEQNMGRDVVDELMVQKRQIRQFTLEELDAMIEGYTARIKKAKAEKGIL